MSKFKMSHTHTITLEVEWISSLWDETVQWITHRAECVSVCTFAPYATQWPPCASDFRVSAGEYMRRLLNHGSCYFCVCACATWFVKAHSVLSIWLSACIVNHKTQRVSVCVDGAAPDEVTGKGWPFRGPSLSPSHRLGINYSPSFSHTNWCMYTCSCLREGLLFFLVFKMFTGSQGRSFGGIKDIKGLRRLLLSFYSNNYTIAAQQHPHSITGLNLPHL